MTTWRSLPPDGKPRQRATPPAAGKRAKDRLGPEGVAQLVADYQAGIPTTQLMKLYGLGKGAVLRLLEANDVPRRRQGLTAGQAHEAVLLYQQGWSSLKIGQHFGKDHGVVLRALKRAGIERRDSHGRILN
jgi:hypothetical protein